MKKDVFLQIRGNKIDRTGQNEEVELIAGGVYSYDKDLEQYTIEYDETELSGMGGTKTKIIADKSSVHLVRDGSFNSHFVIEKGKKFIGSYQTPYGAIALEIMPTDVDCALSEDGGLLSFRYSLFLGGESTDNIMSINVYTGSDALGNLIH